MTLDTFWELVERSRPAVGSKGEHADALVEMLTTLEVEAIIEFERHLFARKSESYRHDLWLACYLLSEGYASDDGFKDFRSYLISRGRTVFESAVRDPDSLADLIPAGEHPSYEEFVYSAGIAYQKKTGRHFDEDDIDVRVQPEGFVMWELTRPHDEPVTFEDAARILPKLKHRFDEAMNRCLSAAKEEYRSPDPDARWRAISDFNRFAAHSPEALALLQEATRDKSKENQQQAKKFLKRHQRNAAGG